jgi:hypothetical protein
MKSEWQQDNKIRGNPWMLELSTTVFKNPLPIIQFTTGDKMNIYAAAVFASAGTF